MTVPSSGTAVATIARLTWKRLFRGRALWIGVVVAALPIAFSLAVQAKSRATEFTFVIEILVLSVLPPLYIASSIGEEIEHRTTTYLWSRPIARWTVLVGKLVALAPIAVVLVVASWMLAIRLGFHELPHVESCVGLGAGALATAAISAGIATVVPKHGMGLAIAYLGIDFVIGQIPASLQLLSATHQTTLLARSGSGRLEPAIALAVIATFWLALGLYRVRRLES